MNTNIKKFFILIGITLFIYILTIFIAVYKFTENANKFHTVHTNTSMMLKYSNVLRQSSENLSKYARLYVVTGNKEYKEIYLNILDIRNGIKKTPSNYHNVYWNLLEPSRSQRHPLEKKKSLNEILKELPYDEYEYEKLKEARLNSDNLVELEIEAFSAMSGLYKDSNSNYSIHAQVNQEKAIELLHSYEYMKAKELIMLPMDEFLEHLDERIALEIKITDELTLYKTLFVISIVLFIILFSLSLIIIIKKILNPIVYLSKAMYDFKNHRENDNENKIFYDDEIGYMSEQFYEMKENITNDINKLSNSKKKAKEYISLIDENVITSSTDLAGVITYASEAFCNICGYTHEELIGNKHSIVKDPETDPKIYDDLWETITANKSWSGDIKNRKKDGSIYWVHATIHPIYDNHHKKIGYTSIRLDISATKEVENILNNSKLQAKELNSYISLVDKNVITSSTNLAGKITYVSEAFCTISGYTSEELIGHNHSMVKHEDMPNEIYDELWDSITNNRTWQGEIKNKRKNGDFYWVDATIYPMFNDNGEKIGYTAIRLNITDKKRVEELLVTDALTGIYNRRYFNESLPRAINLARRDNKYFAFIMMDIDHFKLYNDRYGHHNGDNVLTQVAKTIESSINRASDMCFRLGGEEFGVIFEALTPKESYEFADTIRANIEKLKIPHEDSLTSKYVTLSIGLVVKHSSEKIVDEEVYKEADSYLYKAKESGRNRVETNQV